MIEGWEADYIQCVGNVCGSCGHKHKVVKAAIRCYDKHTNSCYKQGGYSDRSIYLMKDGRKVAIIDVYFETYKVVAN